MMAPGRAGGERAGMGKLDIHSRPRARQRLWLAWDHLRALAPPAAPRGGAAAQERRGAGSPGPRGVSAAATQRSPGGRAAPRVTRITPGASPVRVLLAEYRESWGLFAMLVRRTILVRYSQTIVGVGWAMLQPLALMLIFSTFFGFLARMPSDDIPYPLFFCAGLWAWQLAAQAVGQGSVAIVANGHIVGKVYFPRAMLPAAAVAVALLDLLAAAPALALVMLVYGAVPDPLGVLVFLLTLLATIALLLGVTLWLSAPQALYRDTAYLVSFLLQLWMFVSPVIYPASLVPEGWRTAYAMNPMAAFVEATRFAFAGGPPPAAEEIAAAILVSLAALLLGHRFFRLREAHFADAV